MEVRQLSRLILGMKEWRLDTPLPGVLGPLWAVAAACPLCPFLATSSVLWTWCVHLEEALLRISGQFQCALEVGYSHRGDSVGPRVT